MKLQASGAPDPKSLQSEKRLHQKNRIPINPLRLLHRRLGTRICVSAAVAEGAAQFCGRPVGDLLLRGRSEPLRAYEPLAGTALTGSATAQYSEAFAKLEAGDSAAMPAFAALVGSHAGDTLAGFHLRRLLNGAKSVRIQLE
jgi:hypothetical protein